MNNTLGSISFCFFTVTLPAQHDSVPLGRVAYIQQTETQADISRNGYSTLLFNRSCSVYIHNSAPAQDSSYRTEEYIFPVNITGDKEGFPVFKSHVEKKLLCKIECRQYPTPCVLTDTFASIAWVFHPERKRLGPYECHRASGWFRGREYEAWYAPDIPVPSGPFKLGGLPGLILEACSTDGKVKFLFGGLEISPGIRGFIVPPSGRYLNISCAEYVKGELDFIDSLRKRFKAQGVDATVQRMEAIELDNSY
jgi:GLPGLI family protein